MSQVGRHIIALTISLRVRALHLTICSETYISFLLILADKNLYSKTQLSSYPAFIMRLKLLNRVTFWTSRCGINMVDSDMASLSRAPLLFVYSQYLMEILFLLLNFGMELVAKVHWNWVACGGIIFVVWSWLEKEEGRNGFNFPFLSGSFQIAS